jgi:hypothetical protein
MMLMKVYFVLYVALLVFAGAITWTRHGQYRDGEAYSFWLWLLGFMIALPVLAMAAVQIFGG